MKAFAELYRSLPQSAAVVWEAMADPRSDRFREGLDMKHAGLTKDGMVRVGSQVAIMPHPATMKKVPWLFRRLASPVLPIAFEVRELDPDRFHRLDVIDNPLVQGQIDRTVREEGKGAEVTVLAELSTFGIAGNLLTHLIPNGTLEEAMERHLDMALGSLAAVAAELANPDNA